MKLILALTAAALVCGCASVPNLRQADSRPLASCDYAKMQTIDQAAQTRGVYVEWVHCPTAKRERT